jgi:4a-hydroxytetrahydrobiopterin dehydratase
MGLVDDPAVEGWTVVGDHLHRELTFADFNEAFGFMARVALIAEKLDHHPEWSNVWNRVVIDITSHDEGGISELCVTFATRVNKVLGE